MVECFGCGKEHPNEACANTASDFLIPVLCLTPMPAFLVVLGISRFIEWSQSW